MCGRYVLFTDEEEDEITELVHEIQRRLDKENAAEQFPHEAQSSAENGRAGKPLRVNEEVFPTQFAPVLTAAGPTAMCWGLPAFKGSGVIINARAESVFDKSFYRQAMYSRRLVVPSHGFFEWRKQPNGDGEKPNTKANEIKAKEKKAKEKLLFNLPGERPLYMAGLYNSYEDGDRFAILTTAANDAMKPIHHRMPVVLSASEIALYLNDEKAARAIIARVPSALEYAAV